MFGWGKRSQEGGDAHQWDSHLSERYENQDGYTQSNNIRNENMAYEQTYRAKPISRDLILRWEDRLGPNSSAAQKQSFSFNLPRDINGFDVMSLTHASYNTDWFVNMGAVLCIGMDPIRASATITSADNTGLREFIPVFAVTNVGRQFGGSNIEAPSNYYNYMHQPTASIRNTDLTNITISLGDESLELFQVNPVPPVTPFHCTLVFHLE